MLGAPRAAFRQTTKGSHAHPCHRSTAALVLLLCARACDRRSPAPVFTAEDMLAIRTFAGGQPLAVSSTGRWIAYVLTDRDDEWNVQEPRPTGHVYVQALAADGPARRAR